MKEKKDLKKLDLVEAVEEAKKNPEIEVTAVDFYNNSSFGGVDVSWSGKVGFGHLEICFDKKDGKLKLHTECMGGKEFAKEIFSKIIESCEVED